jgi:hypothetical protein
MCTRVCAFRRAGLVLCVFSAAHDDGAEKVEQTIARRNVRPNVLETSLRRLRLRPRPIELSLRIVAAYSRSTHAHVGYARGTHRRAPPAHHRTHPQSSATSAPGLGHICVWTRPHLRLDSATSASGLGHICVWTRPHLRLDPQPKAVREGLHEAFGCGRERTISRAHTGIGRSRCAATDSAALQQACDTSCNTLHTNAQRATHARDNSGSPQRATR